MLFGFLVRRAGLAVTVVKSLPLIACSLVVICGAYFTLHAAAVGSPNRNLTSSQGRANSLYTLAYYLGGAAGISASGMVYLRNGWHGVMALGLLVLLVPLAVGIMERKES